MVIWGVECEVFWRMIKGMDEVILLLGWVGGCSMRGLIER